MANPVGRPLKYKTVAGMQTVVDSYFDACSLRQLMHRDSEAELPEDYEELLLVTDDVFPTVTGLALALDLTRKSLIEYEVKKEYLNTIKKAKAKVEAFIEQRLFSGNATGCIFNLKNNFGWKDQTQVDSTSNINLNHTVNIVDVNDRRTEET